MMSSRNASKARSAGFHVILHGDVAYVATTKREAKAFCRAYRQIVKIDRSAVEIRPIASRC